MGMLFIIIRTVLSFVIAIAVHEAGHYVVARLFGYKPRLEFNRLQIWKIGAIQPCVVVEDPMTDTARRAFGVAGFGFEFGICVLLLTAALIVPSAYCLDLLLQSCLQAYIAWGHFWAYPFYNKGGESNDFRWLS